MTTSESSATQTNAPDAEREMEFESDFESDEARLEGLVEAILFAAGEGVRLRDIEKRLEISQESLARVVAALQASYQKSERGIRLIRAGDTLRLVTKSEYYPQVAQVLGRSQKKTLSRASAEVLAIVAYLQPVTRIDIDQIRGVGSASALQRLTDLGIVEECGKLEVAGHPRLYRTTDAFLRLAGIENLTELPDYDSFRPQTG